MLGRLQVRFGKVGACIGGSLAGMLKLFHALKLGGGMTGFSRLLPGCRQVVAIGDDGAHRLGVRLII